VGVPYLPSYGLQLAVALTWEDTATGPKERALLPCVRKSCGCAGVVWLNARDPYRARLVVRVWVQGRPNGDGTSSPGQPRMDPTAVQALQGCLPQLSLWGCLSKDPVPPWTRDVDGAEDPVCVMQWDPVRMVPDMPVVTGARVQVWAQVGPNTVVSAPFEVTGSCQGLTPWRDPGWLVVVPPDTDAEEDAAIAAIAPRDVTGVVRWTAAGVVWVRLQSTDAVAAAHARAPRTVWPVHFGGEGPPAGAALKAWLRDVAVWPPPGGTRMVDVPRAVQAVCVPAVDAGPRSVTSRTTVGVPRPPDAPADLVFDFGVPSQV
jgi:hypothetical protein